MKKLLVIFLTVISLLPALSFAQIERPTEEYLFRSDEKDFKRQKEKATNDSLKTESPKADNLDFKSPNVKFDQQTNIMSGDGGVLISGRGIQVQAEQASMDLDTNDAELKGEVLFSAPHGYLSAEEATVNLDSETGRFENGRVQLEEGGYWAKGVEILKISEYQYRLFDCRFSTCHCEDGQIPWSFSTSKANITQEGYAHLDGATVDLYGVPLFYTPYMLFPVKTERASGLLAPHIGYGSKDGVQAKIPLFLALDDSTDLIFTPFTEVKTRTGMVTDFREAFSRLHQMAGRLVYSNERARDGSLRGTEVQNLFDPTFDEDRFGGFYRHSWRTEPDSSLPLSVAIDGRYVSDDLFLREIDDEEIGKYNSRYVVSRALATTNLGDFVTAELSSEYSQSMLTNDDLVFKRLPEFTINGLKSVRPFGSNPYGLKLVNKLSWTTTNFYRTEGFDGLRSDIYPNIKMPFHVQNYVNGSMYVEGHKTFYDLNNATNPSDNTELDDTNDRFVPAAGASLGTAVEKVFSVPSDGWLATIAELGKANQDSKLVRMKHGIEPTLLYSYVPDVSQEDLPLFDSLDRIRKKSVFTFNLRNALYGRYDPTLTSGNNIEELTPRIGELPVLGFDRIFGEYGQPEQFELGAKDLSQSKGEVREVVTFDLQQSYDYFEATQDNDPQREAWSDLGAALELYPNKNFRIRFDSNYNYSDQQFSSYGVLGQINDDRGDAIRGRVSYIDNQVDQFDGNIELALTRRVRVGYYGKYDSIENRFLNHNAALRLLSACNCWKIDIGYIDRYNPDKQGFGVTFTLAGLGDIGS